MSPAGTSTMVKRPTASTMAELEKPGAVAVTINEVDVAAKDLGSTLPPGLALGVMGLRNAWSRASTPDGVRRLECTPTMEGP